MAKASKAKGFEDLKDPERHLVAGPGGATHQTADAAEGSLTTKQAVIVADNHNTLKSGGRGPSFLEDLAFRELDGQPGVGQYIEAAKQQRVWAREARLSESDA
jgi:hypothetical protein